MQPRFGHTRKLSVRAALSGDAGYNGEPLQRFGAVVNSVRSPAYQAGMDARFATAARHSRMVRVLRIAVPGAVILAMTAILFVSGFNPFRMLLPKLPLDMGNLVVSGTKITLESPHLTAYSTDRPAYDLSRNTPT